MTIQSKGIDAMRMRYGAVQYGMLGMRVSCLRHVWYAWHACGKLVPCVAGKEPEDDFRRRQPHETPTECRIVPETGPTSTFLGGENGNKDDPHYVKGPLYLVRGAAPSN